MESRIEDDAIAFEVRGQERELGRAVLGGQELASLGAAPGRVSLLERSHVEADGPGRRLQDDGERQAQEAQEALFEALVLDAGPGEPEGFEEVGQAGEGDEAGIVGQGSDQARRARSAPKGMGTPGSVVEK
jgi:hypothetical protein